MACAVLTVSDTRTAADDRSGDLLAERLEGAGHRVVAREIVPDDAEVVRVELGRLLEDEDIEAVLLTGGTGVARRDNTYEVVDGLLDKRIDGFGELFRMLSHREIGAAAMLSRAVGGIAGTTAVFSMPGSTAACRLAMEELILPELGHLVGLLRPADSGG